MFYLILLIGKEVPMEQEKLVKDDLISSPKFNQLEINSKEVENTKEVENMIEVENTKDVENTIEDNITTEVVPEFKNAKEKLYDKIPISLKALDVFISICAISLVVLMVYFIIRRY